MAMLHIPDFDKVNCRTDFSKYFHQDTRHLLRSGTDGQDFGNGGYLEFLIIRMFFFIAE